ncbi:hypothetical protein VIBNISFn118_10009 [Vibrio nigripulchritudo SFn118]|nr:hypothetical protein VIBNISFn118_10009 [Vibrio nigripulchritudo SFn118]
MRPRHKLINHHLRVDYYHLKMMGFLVLFENYTMIFDIINVNVALMMS